jgi:hypothetical protein
MAQGISHRAFLPEIMIQYQESPCQICGGQTGTGTGFFSEHFVVLLYHSPVTHTHEVLIYHRRNTILATDSVVKQQKTAGPHFQFYCCGLTLYRRSADRYI